MVRKVSRTPLGCQLQTPTFRVYNLEPHLAIGISSTCIFFTVRGENKWLQGWVFLPGARIGKFFHQLNWRWRNHRFHNWWRRMRADTRSLMLVRRQGTIGKSGKPANLKAVPAKKAPMTREWVKRHPENPHGTCHFKSVTWPWPSTAPATKSDNSASPSTAPATKMTLELHQVLLLDVPITWRLLLIDDPYCLPWLLLLLALTAPGPITWRFLLLDDSITWRFY